MFRRAMRASWPIAKPIYTDVRGLETHLLILLETFRSFLLRRENMSDTFPN